MRKIQIVLICTACLFYVSSTVSAQESKNTMTNADVVEMIKAELSEQIITTSIRQALAKSFDLTPTGLISLKKAGVPDAIILVMQDANASVKSVSTSGDKVPNGDSETSSNNSNASVKQELVLIFQQLEKASIAGDKETINKLLTDDFVQILNDKEYNKAWILKNVKPLKDISLDIENTKLGLEGENATLTGTEVLYTKNGSKSYKFISKFVKRDGQWLLAYTKYDLILAETQKTVTTTTPQNGCTGIESLGIFKNTAISPEIGGGIVEWLAKIRNNTAVTKIVVFGWRDMYGQQRKAQAQIGGGEIASLRLDLTQARVIPPVAELQLLSCQ
jgi:hypothetical protein